MPEENYEKFMAEAIALAEESRFSTYPNPAVGAVLVKDGAVVARGRHRGAGMPHAEIECLEDARSRGIDPAGTTLVVTLEPCVHYGKTPPCSDAILAAGIKTLVYGCEDPNSEAAGGARLLAEKGVEVIGPVLKQECEDLIADFRVWREGRRPYVILKLACTLDGRIATRSGHSKWISDESARKDVHRLRSAIGKTGGAILIGGGTFRGDNPALTYRLDEEKDAPQPLACVLTSRLPKADADFHLLTERPKDTVFFASPAATASTAAEALRKLGCRIFAVGPSRKGGPDFDKMFAEIKEDLHCPYVLCEGGGKLAFSLLRAGFIDEFHLHMAPIILGDNEATPLFNGNMPLSLEDGLSLRFCKTFIRDNNARLLLRPATKE